MKYEIEIPDGFFQLLTREAETKNMSVDRYVVLTLVDTVARQRHAQWLKSQGVPVCDTRWFFVSPHFAPIFTTQPVRFPSES